MTTCLLHIAISSRVFRGLNWKWNSCFIAGCFQCCWKLSTFELSCELILRTQGKMEFIRKQNERELGKRRAFEAQARVQNKSIGTGNFSECRTHCHLWQNLDLNKDAGIGVVFHRPLPSERATLNEYISVQFSATPMQFHRELLHQRNLEAPRRAILQGRSSRHVSTVVEVRSFIAVAGCLRRLLCDYLLSI